MMTAQRTCFQLRVQEPSGLVRATPPLRSRTKMHHQFEWNKAVRKINRLLSFGTTRAA
jgi:hypothetical protein